MIACPLLVAYTRYTATWAFSIRPAVPVYWRCTPTVVCLLEIASLIDDQHRLVLAQVLDEVGAHVIADCVLIPHRSAEQVLHPVGAGVVGVLGDRPAVLAWQVRQPPEPKRPGVPSWSYNPKLWTDPEHVNAAYLPG